MEAAPVSLGIRSVAEGRALHLVSVETAALFLDFDGTLAPIVARPELAGMSERTRDAVGMLKVGCGGALAVLSGRPLDQLRDLLSPVEPAMAGSHGAEISRPGEADLTLGDEAQNSLDRVHERLSRLARREDLLIERKRGSVCLHYRSRPDLEQACNKAAADAVRGRSGLKLMRGHMVVEIALAGIDKGTALAALMSQPPFAGRVPVAAGDDTTDEDAIRSAQKMGGIGIRIGDGPSEALVRFKGIEAFLDWLETLARDGRAEIGTGAA